MENIKGSAIKLLKFLKLDDKTVTFKNLLKAVRKKGFLVYGYSKSDTLLMTFGLFDESKEADSVSAVDKSGVVYIFIDDSLSDEYQLFALAHETGHIMLKHRKTQSLKRQQEREADLFAHYLLSNNSASHKKSIVGIVCMLLSVCLIFLIATQTAPITNKNVKTVSVETNNYEDDFYETDKNALCYFTKYGEVYHLYSDCQYVRNAKYVYSDTIEHSYKDRLCSACERRLNNK